MRAALLVALAACGFPRPPDVGSQPIDAVAPDAVEPLPPGKSLTDFRVLQMDNKGLPHDLKVVQSGTAIDVYAFMPPTELTPRFTTDGASVTANGNPVDPNGTAVALVDKVTYRVTAQDGTTAEYTVTMHARHLKQFNVQFGSVHTAMVSGAAIGDLDGDGKPEVVIGDITKFLTVFHNESTGPGQIAFTSGTAGSVTDEPDAIAIADLDGDGHNEVLVGSFAGSTIYVFTASTSNGTVTLTQKAKLSGGTRTTSLAIGKLYGGLHPDILATTGSANTVVALQNLSTGTGNFTFGNPTPYGDATDQDTNAVALLDYDGDGHQDIAFTGYLQNTVHILLAGQSYTESGSPSLTQTSHPTSLAVGDIDGDHHPELLIAEGGASRVDALVHAAPTTLPHATLNDLAQCVAAADLDADGRDDVLAITGDTMTATVALEIQLATTGLGFFPATAGSLGAGVYACAGVDLDGDGVPDAVAATTTGVAGASVIE